MVFSIVLVVQLARRFLEYTNYLIPVNSEAIKSSLVRAGGIHFLLTILRLDLGLGAGLGDRVLFLFCSYRSTFSFPYHSLDSQPNIKNISLVP